MVLSLTVGPLPAKRRWYSGGTRGMGCTVGNEEDVGRGVAVLGGLACALAPVVGQNLVLSLTLGPLPVNRRGVTGKGGSGA